MLVVGARSFLGSSLADGFAQEWIRKGIKSVTRYLATGAGKSYQSVPLSGVQDISISYSGMVGTVKGPIDLIVHAASPTAMSEMTDSLARSQLWRHNVALTDEVVGIAGQSLRDFGRICDVVFLSSREIYAGLSASRFVSESDVGFSANLDARSIYRTSKLLGENLLQAAADDELLRGFRLRVGHVYGDGMKFRDGRVLGDVLDVSRPSDKVVFIGDGRHELQPLSVADFTSATFQIVEGGAPNAVWNVAHSVPISIKEIAEIVARASNRKAVAIPAGSRDSVPYLRLPVPLLSTQKLRAIGWVPDRSHDQGISDFVGAQVMRPRRTKGTSDREES